MAQEKQVNPVKSYNPAHLHTPSKPTPTGDGYEYYDEEVADPKTGEIKLKKHRVWIYGLIQEARKTCDMAYILDQIAKGNTSVLEESKGAYMDARDLPQDVQEAQDLKDQAVRLYKENKDLQRLYKNEEAYEKALFSGVDIASQLVKLKLNDIAKMKKPEVKPEVKSEVKPEVKEETK